MLSKTSGKVLAIWDGFPPLQTAGRAATLTRSLMQRRRRMISSAGCTVGPPMLDRRRGWHRLGGSPFAELTEKFLRRYKERILQENGSDHNHRMRPHDINHRPSAKLSKIVHA